jgi:hypothetical protein
MSTPTVRNEKEDMQVRQQFFHDFMEIVDAYPKYPIAQHMAAFLRRKSDSGPEFFHWSNKELLKRLEQYKQELEGEELINETQD